MRKLIVPIGILLFASCYSDKEDELYPKPAGNSCDTANLSFATDIQPIINSNCATAGCHDATTKSFGHDLSSYNGVVTSVNSGRFLGAIRHEANFLPMPKNGLKLPECEMNKIQAWVSQGMKQ